MIVDLERDRTLPDFSADVCVVGAGAAGIVLAAELVRQGRRVLLLESGGATIEQGAQKLNAAVYTGQSHQGASIGRFRALGGTTTAWGGQILELDAEDFTARPWVPGSGWPFPKAALRPYYERALYAEGLTQVIQKDGEVWHEMGVREPDMGDVFSPYFTRWCPEPNFARLYRETMQSPNLCVVLHATVAAMALNENGTSVSAVRCKTLSHREYIFSAEQFVLCLGTIESVRFLLQPLPDGRTPVWNRNGLLGCHFQSHIDVNAARISATEAPRLRRWFANAYLRGYKYHPKFRLSFLEQRQHKVLNIAGSITCINEQEDELQRLKSVFKNALHGRPADFHFRDVFPALRQARIMTGLAYGYAVKHRAYWPKNSSFWLRVHCEQEPLAQSSITLTGTRDAMGQFQARWDWRVSPLEWETIRLFAERAECIFNARNWGKIAVNAELKHPDGYHNTIFDNSHHDMGGARMAETSSNGVVDPNLQLHGVENAYLCSAAVFPCSGFSNPTHTLIALAIRLADHLVARQSSGLPATISTSETAKDNPHA